MADMVTVSRTHSVEVTAAEKYCVLVSRSTDVDKDVIYAVVVSVSVV